VDGGRLVSEASAALNVTGAYTQLAGSTLELVLGSNGAGRLDVSGTATLAGGTLVVSFKAGEAPAVGATVQVITGGRLAGKFTTVTATGFKVTPVYTATGLQLHIDG
jgi:archaellum component FlaF (FlaF/FlaG flagellin family)